MALLDRGNTDFRASVTRTGLHYKTSRLKRLLKALVKVQDNPTDAAKLQYLFKRCHRWRIKEPKEWAARNSRYEELLGEIRTKARTLNLTLVVPGTTEPVGAVAFVNRVRAELDTFKTYACADAFMNTTITGGVVDYRTGFAGCINPAKRTEVRARYQSIQGTRRGATTPFDSHISRGEWKAKNYEMTYARVSGDQAGVCVTFAKAAAHLLTAGQADGPRVEIVSFKNHVYVLVNRQGGDDDGTVAEGWIHEGGVIIVDPWAAAMGFECIFAGTRHYPYMGMVNPITLVATWPPEDDEEV